MKAFILGILPTLLWAYTIFSVASIVISYRIRRGGYLSLGHRSVAPKYTKWMWEHVYDAKSVSMPDSCDITYDLIKVCYRICLAAAICLLGPLLFVTTLFDLLNLLGARLPRRVPEGGFPAERSYPPLTVQLGESDEGHPA